MASTVKEFMPIEWDSESLTIAEGVDNTDRIRLKMQEHYASIVETFEFDTQCMICGTIFKQAMNLVGRFCHMHTGKLRYDPTARRYRWSCCRKERGMIGCTPCMHAGVVWIRDEMYRDPVGAAMEIPADLIDFRLVTFEPRMIVRFKTGSRGSLNNRYNTQLAKELRDPILNSSPFAHGEAVDAAPASSFYSAKFYNMLRVGERPVKKDFL